MILGLKITYKPINLDIIQMQNDPIHADSNDDVNEGRINLRNKIISGSKQSTFM